MQLGAGLAGQVALNRQVLNVPDLQHTSVLPAWREVLSREAADGVLRLPLIAKGQVVGVIEVLNRDR